VVKIQVHAGGRGKAGGVKFAKGKEEILQTVDRLIGMRMINNQTGPQGVVAHQVLISAPVEIAKEYYLAAVIDRENAAPMIIASPEGGMEIEEIAVKMPDRVLKLPIPIDGTIKGYQAMRIAKFMGWTGPLIQEGMTLITGLAKAFKETDALLLEINPLVLTEKGHLIALDAKLSVDDNALFRQPEIKNFYDPTQESTNEVMAREHDLAYVALDGNIGCMVNGAGLAMATVDIIHYFGGAASNFLDVGGGASKEKVAEGFKIILEDPKVKAILVNIFGGIMDCATLAEGIISAASGLHLKMPLVVRMEGTNVEKGKYLLQQSGLDITTADDLVDAAQKAVIAAGVMNF
jgi:succinyl-CoA synthetase beta subunit